MADEEVVVKTPAELAAEAHEKEEARKAAQVQYDPAKHGAGTHPVEEPESVKEMWHKVVKPLLARVESLERRLAPRAAAPPKTQ